MRILPLGDAVLLAELGSKPDAATAATALRLARTLIERHGTVLRAVVPSFCTVAVHFAPGGTPRAEQVEAWIREAEDKPSKSARPSPRTVVLPVCYGGKFGPDLPEVAEHTRMTTAQVIAQHKSSIYDVRAIGFAPGFPYLGGLPGRLSTPRRKTPRTKVPAGSVAIGGNQTGVYPLESPGGWQLIGRTPERLFQPEHNPPVLLRAGDRVRFLPVTPEDFARRAAVVDQEAELAIAQAGGVVGKGPAMTVVAPGLLTTVQDLGRPAMQEHGIPEGGAMDRLAARIGNLLVGNPESAAVLECTLRGPVVRFAVDVEVAVTGARVAGLPYGRPFVVPAGELLSLEPIEQGLRAYLAVNGGFEVNVILGSRSTLLRSGLPGLAGRALRAHDTVPLGLTSHPPANPRGGRWFVSTASFLSPGPVVRIVRGPQADWFPPATWQAFQSATYTLSAQSDRMGLRLSGPILNRETDREMVSHGVAAGTIQVPPDGQPIVLMADRQTIGGYAQLANVITVDLPKLAQRASGEPVRFELVTLAEARRLAAERLHELARLRVALRERLR